MSNYPETSHNDRDSDMDHLRGTFSEIPGLYGDSTEGITFSSEHSKRLLELEAERRPVTKVGWVRRWSNCTAYLVIDTRLETKDEIDLWLEARCS